MDWDDIVYLSLLLFSLVFGSFFRQIRDPVAKKWTSTVVGFLIALIVSGNSIYHSIIITLFHAFLVSTASYKIMHIISFTFSFAYLFFFRFAPSFGLQYPGGHTNLIQMILTLKLVGMTFELKDTIEGELKGKNDPEFMFRRIPKPSFADVFHYAYCYSGIITGPYFSFRTFVDMFITPFAKHAGYKNELMGRLMIVPVLGVIHLVLNKYWPIEYVFTDEFYNECSIWYRIWYTIPAFGQFRSRIYIGLRLSEGVCATAGLGCYPAVTDPKPGKGPSKEYAALTQIANDKLAGVSVEYSYATVHSLEFKADFERRVRPSMKYWNMCVQYWLAEFVYHRFPIKPYRILAVFIVSSYWHGFYAGYYFTLCSVPMYLIIEDKVYRWIKDWEYSPLVNCIFDVVGYLYKISIMGYWAFFFRLLTFEASWRYICSIFFLPHIASMGGAYVVSVILAKLYGDSRKSRRDVLLEHDKRQ
uniref:Lysophospholipid acyltransferase 7 n=1 Tax=Lygus hesperus TaxID=30085 RepID=A0A0A9XEX5_LYGHE